MESSSSKIQSTTQCDTRGLRCPQPLLRAKKALNALVDGDILCVLATDPAAPGDFKAFSKQTGHSLLALEEKEGVFYIYLCKVTAQA